ncbi:homoserine dehydrogenase [Caldanaerobacter sp.]|uniref:homoserine dehydrogenase n=1 Tax=Caldanaerobacter sp. TaxID=2930036 RepID=UPI003C70D687
MRVKIGLMGLGTVGTGVFKIINSRGGYIKESTGFYPEIKKVLVKDLHKKRKVNATEFLTNDPRDILEDEEIKVVIEAIGGISPAYEYVKKALFSGKHVITANKELIAKYGEELGSIAAEKGVYLKYEASVGGAIPILHQIDRLKITDEIDFIGGIVNGTTNYIFTKMGEGKSYKEALNEAQRLGYAEANPDYDVKGLDATFKLGILIKKVFGVRVPVEIIPRKGIEEIKEEDVERAKEWGYEFKLFAWAKKFRNYISAGVEPTLIPENSLLSKVKGVNNAIILKGNGFGEYVFIGRGAGELPTGDAIVADLIDILINYKLGSKSEVIGVNFREESFTDTFYIRLKLKKDNVYGLKEVLKLIRGNWVSIENSSFGGNSFTAIVKINGTVEGLKEQLEKVALIDAVFKVLAEENFEEKSEFENLAEIM